MCICSVKDVKRRLGTASSGKRQLMPERSHPATASKPRDNALVIGTWRVKILMQVGKLENIKNEMASMNVNILDVC